MKKALLVSTVPSTIGQFNMENIQILQQMGIEVHIACNFNDLKVWPKEKVNALIRELQGRGCICHQVDFSRSITKIIVLLRALKQISSLLKKENFTVIHCHTPVAGAITRFAAGKLKNSRKVIYTAHGFHFYQGAPLLNWILYYPVERYLSHNTDIIITINKEDYRFAKKHMKARKVTYVPGVGVDLNKFYPDNEKKISRDENQTVVLVSVGELNANKNHELVLKALHKLRDNNFVYWLCGVGEKERYLKELAARLKIGEKVKFLGFRDDIDEIYKKADIFVFPSKREGLPVSMMEAMASGLPVICSDIRGNRDLIEKDSRGGKLFAVDNEIELAGLIEKLLISPDVRERMGEFNRKRMRYFSSDHVAKKMRKIYNELLFRKIGHD